MKKIRKAKLKRFIQKLFLIASFITMGITSPSKVISQPLSNPKINAIKNVNAKIINFKNNKVVLKIGESEIKYDHLILATHSDQVKEINKIINFDEKIVFLALMFPTQTTVHLV